MSRSSTLWEAVSLRRHPIARVWRNMFFVALGLVCCCFSVIGIFWLGAFLPAFFLGVAALGFGLSARVPGKRWRRRMSWTLCAVFALGMVGGYWAIDKFYYNRPEPNSQDARKVLLENRDALFAAAKAVHPGERYRYDLSDIAPQEIQQAFHVYGVEAIERFKGSDAVRFTIRFPCYFGHEGDYRYLSYVPGDDAMALLPSEFERQQPREAVMDKRSAYYVWHHNNIWFTEWYAERLEPRWFFEGTYSDTEVSRLRLRNGGSGAL